MLKYLPDSTLIVLWILILVVGLTWIIPAGEFQRQDFDGRQVVVPGSYQPTEAQPQSLFDFLTAPARGFKAAAEIIAFVLLVGGAFTVVNSTGAITAGIQKLLISSENHHSARKMVIPLIMVLFSICGATFGMSEEVLVFILITIPLAISLGYDTIVGVSIAFVAAGAGFASAFMNPFTVGIAHGLAELPVFSGWEYRLVVWFVFTTTAIIMVMTYANRIKQNPTLSPMYDIDRARHADGEFESETLNMTTTRKLVLTLFFLSLIMLIVGVNLWDWYINEIAGLFFGLAILTAIIARLSPSRVIEEFTIGMKEMVVAAFVIGLSRGILLVATDGKIIDTILYTISSAAEGFHPAVSVQVMFFVQSGLNFFVPSGSGQAALTIPIMAPLSDLLGITRQTAVLAYQFGDGLSNLIIPTSGITMGILSIAKIPYDVWFRWMGKRFLILTFIGCLLLLPPVLFFYWGPH